MNNKKLFFAILGMAVCILHNVRADELYDDKVSMTGSIIVETSTTQTVVKPLTIENVLSVLAVSSTDSSKNLRYYYDSTTDSFVIAPKGVISGAATSGTATPLATVLTYGDTAFVNWDPTKHTYIDAGTDSGMNGDLTGTGLIQGVFPRNTETDKITFTLFGTITNPTIIKGAILDIYKIGLGNIE